MRNLFSSSAIRKATRIPRGTLMRKRDVARATNVFNKRIREPVPASKKKAVRKRAKNTCEWPGCSHKENLHIHHKNMNNDDNKLSNLILLCPNHHAKMHSTHKRISKKDLLGREVGSKVIKRKPKKKTTRKRKSNDFLGFGKLDLGI